MISLDFALNTLEKIWGLQCSPSGHDYGGGGEIPARTGFASGGEVVGEYEGITCDRFEVKLGWSKEGGRRSAPDDNDGRPPLGSKSTTMVGYLVTISSTRSSWSTRLCPDLEHQVVGEHLLLSSLRLELRLVLLLWTRLHLRRDDRRSLPSEGR